MPVLTEVTVSSPTAPEASVSQPRSIFGANASLGDPIFHALLFGAGALVLIILGSILILLFQGGWPVLQAFGANFFTSYSWNPVTERYGAAVMLYGTVSTAIIAILIAVPVSFGIAFFLTEVAPQPLRRPIGITIQLLAAVPSIIFGMWGFFVIAPLMAAYFQPFLINLLGSLVLGPLLIGLVAAALGLAVAFLAFVLLRRVAQGAVPGGTMGQLILGVPALALGVLVYLFGLAPLATLCAAFLTDHLGEVPVIGTLFTLPIGALFEGPATSGNGILTAGIILALMIVPFISAMFVEILESVPAMFKEAAYGVGATTSEVFTAVCIPYGRSAMVGAVMLGLGRALGETMAVTYVIGNVTRYAVSVIAPGASIASTIALQFPEAGPGSLKLNALLELGFLLFVLSFVVLTVARFLVRSRLES